MSTSSGFKGKNVSNFPHDDALAKYLHTVTNTESEVCQWIRETTARELGIEIRMVPSIDQGRFLTTLAYAINAKLIVEIGVFTGYSSTCLALGLAADDGHLIALDIDEHYTNYAKEAWKRAGVDGKCELRLAPAATSLEHMLQQEHLEGKVDLVFVDADKEGMPEYYEYAMRLLRPRGVCVLDNTLWSGRVYDGKTGDADTQAIRRVNETIAQDCERVFSVQLPFSDGVTVVTKK